MKNSTLPTATPADLAKPVIRNRRCRLCDVPAEPDGSIRGKTFIGCHVMGPDVIDAREESTMFDGCSFVYAGDDPDSLFVAAGDGEVVGAIRLPDCIFGDCRFERVAFCVAREAIESVMSKIKFHASER